MKETSPKNSLSYVGRFAPSPTGPLHFGSLVAAVGSYLEARHRGGRWLVRMEDLDPLREVPGAGDLILRTLEAYGLEWDGEVMFQSRRSEAYAEALKRLAAEGSAYPCTCSRKEIAETAAALGRPAAVYPGTCRGRAHAAGAGRHALRVLTAGAEVRFQDRLQGEQRQALEAEVGDFVVYRADGQVAYQLAVVVDDAAQGVTEVVRGSDLLDSTPRQIHLQRLLGLPTPGYLHLPVAVNAAGEKLSKQTYAPALSLDEPAPALWTALDFLGQAPPEEARGGDARALLSWAVTNWRPEAVPAQTALLCPEGAGSAPNATAPQVSGPIRP